MTILQFGAVAAFDKKRVGGEASLFPRVEETAVG
jgi:hypothetical protein